PSIVIVLLGTLAGDLYATAQEARAQSVGCSDALTYLGEAAVVSVGTLFQAAILPGILLALLYASYAFGFAILNPSKAPPVQGAPASDEIITRGEALTWFLAVPMLLVVGTIMASSLGVIGSQNVTVDSFSDATAGASLRTNVSGQCSEAMIDLHGQEAWDTALAEQAEIEAGGGAVASTRLTEDELVTARADKIASRAPIGTGIAIGFLLAALLLALAKGIAPSMDARPLAIGALGIVLGLLADILLISPVTSPGMTFLILLIPLVLTLYGARAAARPPLILIIAVLGSILGGITNPTPAAALGAGGALMLAAFRKLQERGGSGRIILATAFAVVVMILVGVNFDLRVGVGETNLEQVLAYIVAQAAYLFAIFGLFYACLVLWFDGVLPSIVRETAKVTSMVFTILIGSQLLNLVVISFGGEHYIQSFLR
ncbi:hypothetical protein LCGC14_2719480, partial [marine sediment metagenome]